MKEYPCEYRNPEKIGVGEHDWRKTIEAPTPREAYEKFIKTVGVYPDEVVVETAFMSCEIFNDHVELALQKEAEDKKATAVEKNATKGNQKGTDQLMLEELKQIRKYIGSTNYNLEILDARLARMKWLLFSIALMLWGVYFFLKGGF